MKIKVKITRNENAEYYGVSIGDIVEVDFETYVASVVASELASGGLEGCKAQAVAARTFAVHKGVLRGKAISDSSAVAQAYRANRYDASKYPIPLQAARETDGQILTYNGNVIDAVYSASNGGRTVSSQERWGSVLPYLIAQPDSWDAATGQPKNGHGVGMSQVGARYAAQTGVSYKDILAFYYPGTKLTSLYGEAKEVIPVNEKVQAIIELAKSKMGDPYVYGTSGHKCTPEVRRRYASYRPEHKAEIYEACPVLSQGRPGCAGCKWYGHLCYDCRGFTSYVLRTAANIKLDGGGATTQYNTNANWAAKGEISGMPNVLCCVFKKRGNKMSHTGLHIGDGVIIHCSTVVKEGSIADDIPPWTHYGVPAGLYTNQEIKSKEGIALNVTLRRGSKGDAVRELQLALYHLDHEDLMVDGIFGGKTEAAVRDFQAKCGLTADGIVGPKTWAAIAEMLQSVGIVDLVKTDDEEAKESEPAEKKQFESPYGYVPDDGLPVIENKPVSLVYPAGQKITLDAATAADIAEKIKEKAGQNPVEIVAGVGFNVTLSAIGAMNVYQQMQDAWGVTK